jgi:S1-C subfamily serine protease
MKTLTTKKVLFLIIIVFGTAVNFLMMRAFVTDNINSVTAEDLRLDEQEATIRAIKKIMPAVVSIVVYDQEKNLKITTGNTTVTKERVKKGSGTGFLISGDGLILTNKHVVNIGSKDVEYRIILTSGKQYFAQLIGKDPLYDLAVLKIFDKNLPSVELGDSDDLQAGSSVIAIGNALGLYQNSVTKGIVSGLGRSLLASDQAGNAEALDNVIQTDAEINLGNSGGPLIDLNGKVIGVNVAFDQAGSAIGFSIPINDARPVINSIRESGRIIRPRMGVRYTMITPEIAQEKKLIRETGALIIGGENGEPAILADSPAAKSGLMPGDIVFEVNGIKVEKKNTLLSISQKYKPGNKIGLKIQRGSKIIIVTMILDEFK